jgi:probable F420-dependent oxidoreductase
MATPKPFRFGAGAVPAQSRAELVDHARKVEDLGYATIGTGEHPGFGHLSPLPAMVAVADATTQLRLSCLFANDLHNPVLLAMEAATLDFLSEGRLEFGLGSGWLARDYAACGVPFDPPAVRVARLEEAVPLIKRLFREGPVSFAGNHYQIEEADLQPKPTQQPGPPIFIGGGGRRVLSLAAREADIVGLDPKATAAGAKDLATAAAAAVDRQVAWVREAAGARFPDLELHVNALAVVVTDDRRAAAGQVAAMLADLAPALVANPLNAEQILEWPQALIGTVEQIAEDLQARRERYGISYVGVPGDCVEAFAPVVTRLAGR